MKNLLFTLFLFSAFIAYSQPWTKNLPSGKAKNELTFYDYQKAFNDYWASYNVDKGFYFVNGVMKKAAGWKQFKRWEYDMEGQIDPVTGTFPLKSAGEIYRDYLSANPPASPKAANWTSLGSSTSEGGYAGIGRLNCIAFHPSNNNMYWVGAASGGLWLTTNNGASWTCLTDNIGVLAVSDIVIPSDYNTSTTIYIATGDKDAWDNRSIGVLKSTDGGSTWNATGISYTLSQNAMVNRLLLSPDNNSTLIAATSNGVYKTTNGGTAWSTQLTTYDFIDMEYKPGDFNTLYGATDAGVIYVSTNSGGTWTQAFSNSSAYRIELAVSANQPSWVFAVAAASDNGLYGIYKSTNSGTSYTQVFSGTTKNLLGWYDGNPSEDTGGQGWYDLSLAASPTNANTLLVGGVDTWRSTNGGTSWTIVNHWYGGYSAQAVHADKHMLRYRSNNDLFECNDGGVYISTDNGSNWTDKTNGLIISQIYKLSNAATSANEVITGLQDNGTKLLSGGIWSDVKGGDGMECLIDYSNLNIQYGTYCYGQITRTTDHWINTTDIEPASAGDGAWVTPYIIDPVNPATLYAGYANVWKTTNRGNNWTQISTMNSTDKIRSMAIAPSNNLYLYVADYTHIWKTTNGGSSWSEITGSLPVGTSTIRYIAVKNDDPSTIWVALSGYNANKVYQTVNGGSSWTNISAGLPSLPAYSIVQNKQITGEVHLYVGTELGVYFKKGNDNWIAYNTNLPNVKIGEIEIYYDANPANSKLRAATYGRGLWQTPVFYTNSNMEYVSTTATQNNTTMVAPNQTNQEIIGIEIVTSGSLNPLNVSSFVFNTTGSTNPAGDITGASVFYTGTTNTFSPVNQFGTTYNSPNGSFLISGSQALSEGTNYFWLAYNIPSGATIGNYLDAQCTSVTVGSTYAPSITDPAGNRQIGIQYCTAGGVSCDEYISNVAIGTINNASGCSGGYTDYTSLSTNIIVGQALGLVVTNGNTGYSDDRCGVWIDWNNNGNFSDDQAVSVNGTPGVGPYSASVIVPDGTPTGLKRMRIRIHYNDEATSPCGTSVWGEVEDYTLNVVVPQPLNYLAYKAQSVAGTYIDLGSNGTVISTDNSDDANSSAQNIGFTFNYNQHACTQFILNTNGFIKLGNTPPSSTALFYTAPTGNDGGIFNSTSTADVDLIAPFNHDLMAGTATPEYRVFTSGSLPNRVCTIQFKNVRDKTTDPLQQYDNIEFQIKLYETTNIIEFIYGNWIPSVNVSAYKSAACGLKGSGSNDNQLLVVGKSSSVSWANVYFQNANYTPGNYGMNFGNPPSRPKPDIGQTYRFYPIYNNDLTIREIYALGEASSYFSSPQFVGVNIINSGITAQNNVAVTVNITGANTYSETVYLNSINPMQSITVHFSGFNAIINGTSNITASLPNDDFNGDNAKTWVQNTTDYSCNYAASGSSSSGWGYGAGGEGVFYVKYYVTGSANVTHVRAFIHNYAQNVGKTVFGMVLDQSGNVAGQSPDYIIQAGDLGTWHEFSITSVPVITNSVFYAGFGVRVASEAYYAMGLQNENPNRGETYYYSAIDGTGLYEEDPATFLYRFMIGATLSVTPPVGGTAVLSSTPCYNSTVTLTLTNYAGNIQWHQSADGSANWMNVSGGTGANSPAYTSGLLTSDWYFRAMVSQPNYAAVYSNVVFVQLISQTQITQQPVSQSVTQGATASFSVQATGSNLSYQWEKNGSTVSGANSNVYTINNVSSSDAGVYHCVVSGDCGIVTSNDVSLTVSPVTYTVTFNITSGGSPLSGATVTLNGVTNTAGNYVFTGIAPGTYSYSVIKTGYIAQTGSATVTSSDLTVNVNMPAVTTYTVTFNITSGGSALSGATVTFNGVTNAAGNYVFTGIAPGTYSYTVTKTGYVAQSGSSTVTSSDLTVNVNMPAVTTYTVTFNITSGGSALSGATVTFNGVTNAAGNYVFTGIAPGTYSYTVTKTGYVTQSGNATVVSANLDVNVNMQLITYSVTFNVSYNGTPVSDAFITLNGVANTQGNYVFSNLAPGTYTYGVSCDGYQMVNGNVSVVNADVTENIILVPVAGNFNVIFNVNIATVPGFNPQSDVVYISGTMNDWTIPGINPDYILQTTGNPAIYKIQLQLPADVYQYMYFVNAGGTGGEIEQHERTVASDTVFNDHFISAISQAGSENVMIYPNPFVASLIIANAGNIQEIRLTDYTGKEILNQFNHKDKMIEIKTMGLKPGFYLIKLMDINGYITVYKAIKQ